MGKAVIVASGPSARGFVPPDDVAVIAVNGAIEWLPRADHWFSLDASRLNVKRLRMKRFRRCEYHVAGPHWPTLLGDATYWRRVDSLGTYPEPAAEGSPEWWLWRWGAVLGINKIPGHINSGNSAWGALGLAWHLGFRDVALIGVDASNDERVEGGRPNELKHLPLLFASALPDMRVVSCGKMTGIPRLTFNQWYTGEDHG